MVLILCRVVDSIKLSFYWSAIDLLKDDWSVTHLQATLMENVHIKSTIT